MQGVARLYVYRTAKCALPHHELHELKSRFVVSVFLPNQADLIFCGFTQCCYRIALQKQVTRNLEDSSFDIANFSFLFLVETFEMYDARRFKKQLLKILL